MNNEEEEEEVIYTGDSILYNEKIEEDIEFFEENLKHTYENGLPEYLSFHSSFPRNGKQGVLGLLENDKTGRKYVYKMSQNLNYLVHQEHSVMEGMNSIREYCPHFCKTVGMFKTSVSENFKKTDNPFEVSNDDGDEARVISEVLLMEVVEGRKFYRYIKNSHITPEICMSIVKQTLLATLIASEALRFTHYDLHSNNILIKKCPINSVFLYILDENRTYLVPTYGYYPIIIDFGFSFNKNCEGKPMFGPLAHTDIGFIPSTYDQHSDSKLFLTSVSHEMEKYKDCEVSQKFRSLVVNVYKNCDIDLECGWDDTEGTSISDQLLKKMKGQFKRSKFFSKHGHHVVDMLQSLVILPLKHRETSDNVEDLTGCIITELAKIEREITSEFYIMYIVKNIIEFARIYRKDYLDKNTRDDAVSYFKQDSLGCIDSVVAFCNPKINWEKLLCSLLCLSKCIENFCFEKLRKLMSYKKADYNHMKLKNTTEIYESIEANIPSHFFFDKDTSIYVWDCVKQRGYKTKINDKFTDTINETHPYERGTIIYDYLSAKNY
jgi:hypothetical protein